MLCPRQGANCCYIDNVKLLQDLIKNQFGLLYWLGSAVWIFSRAMPCSLSDIMTDRVLHSLLKTFAVGRAATIPFSSSRPFLKSISVGSPQHYSFLLAGKVLAAPSASLTAVSTLNTKQLEHLNTLSFSPFCGLLSGDTLFNFIIIIIIVF